MARPSIPEVTCSPSGHVVCHNLGSSVLQPRCGCDHPKWWGVSTWPCLGTWCCGEENSQNAHCSDLAQAARDIFDIFIYYVHYIDISYIYIYLRIIWRCLDLEDLENAWFVWDVSTEANLRLTLHFPTEAPEIGKTVAELTRMVPLNCSRRLSHRALDIDRRQWETESHNELTRSRHDQPDASVTCISLMMSNDV